MTMIVSAATEETRRAAADQVGLGSYLLRCAMLLGGLMVLFVLAGY